MTLSPREWLARLNRAQRSRLFKIIASAVVLVLGIGVLIAYQVGRATEAPAVVEGPSEAELAKLTKEQKERAVEEKTTAELTAKAFNQLMETKADTTSVAIGVALVSMLLWGVIWLGHGLSLLAVLFVVLFILGPPIPIAMRMGRVGEVLWYVPYQLYELGLRQKCLFVAAVGTLAISFFVLIELARLLLAGPSAVLAIARNVVLEATRMRVALVFIVMLLFGLAALPGLLDPGTPLRYRVQNFMQYATGGTFAIVAVLVLFLAVASVAFEQRDKIIWQTMTKPVAAWQYLLGKWLGVVTVAAVLLGVSCSGIFLFTEYLRDQPAHGERVAFEPEKQEEFVTEDRVILESQVLTARRAVRPDASAITEQEETIALRERYKKALESNADFRLNEEEEKNWREEIRRQVRATRFTIEPGNWREFVFSGLSGAREAGRFVTLRYKVDVGANDPRTIYDVTIAVRNVDLSRVQQVPVGQSLTIQIPPAAIDSQGKLWVLFANGRMAPPDRIIPNPQSMSFPPDGLEVYFPDGSYRLNFMRVTMVLWLKLAFLAMVGVTASTFLSFPVAALVAFGVFFMAQSAGYLFTSLDYFASVDDKGNIDYFATVIRGIAWPISRAFRFYSDLKPTSSLVDGRMVPWSRVLSATAIIGSLCAVLYAIGVTIFRKRELATYSGQ